MEESSKATAGPGQEDRIREMSARLSKLEMYFRVAFCVGAIFGAVGVWGYQVVTSVSSRITALDTDVAEVERAFAGVSKRAEDLESTYSEMQREVIPSLERNLLQLTVDTVTANKEAEIAIAQIKSEAVVGLSQVDGRARDAKDQLDERMTSAVAEINSDLGTALSVLQRERELTQSWLDDQREDLASALRSELDSALQSTTWRYCRWIPVGREASHSRDLKEWCPGGSFLTQVNLDSRHGVEVYVSEARCCAPGLGDE